MNKLQRKLDGMIQRFCEWLNDFFPGQHGLAATGNHLAGLERMVLLPVDRRLGPSTLYMAHNVDFRDGVLSGKPPSNTDEKNCGFWAYCHISGKPCVRCGGVNFVHMRIPPWASSNRDKLALHWCPSGTIGGAAWYGCCKNPAGVGKFIAFFDCCGGTITCAPGTPSCHNWPQAKNWCFRTRTGTTRYVCTIVYDLGNDRFCED